eukprot:8282238-Lingulodinium_polyedra.AAC.1
MSLQRKWLTPVETATLGTVHSFTEIDPTSEEVPGVGLPKVPPAWGSPKNHVPVLRKVKGICGAAKKAGW